MMTPPQKELQEKDFINNGWPKGSSPLWIWLCVIAALAALFWGGGAWVSSLWSKKIAASPFLQVTNRQFSVFLWQFPEHMRVNASSKSGYLPGFQYQDKISAFPSEADQYAVAPPEIIFLYHTWKRQIGDQYIAGEIPKGEFLQFLEYDEEWLPKYWPQAPKRYIELIEELPKNGELGDLNILPESTLPREVKQAFQGWKNYFKEGVAINQYRPTYQDVQLFVKKYPNYTRNFWRNIVEKTTPQYLSLLSTGDFQIGDEVPLEELAPFLRVALYNFMKGRSKNHAGTETKPSS